jgi:FKBP-type peptidyl-prolyl cis-trans isomerase SlyD
LLKYQVFDEEDEPIDDGKNELGVVFGDGVLLPAIEERLEGLRQRDQRSIVLSPEQAFGARDNKAIVEVERDEFPEDVAPGDRFEAEAADGSLVVLSVLDVGPDAVVLDGNHPLAGQALRFEVEVAEVRPATAEELRQAAERLEKAGNSPDSEGPALLPVESLLRGPARR